MWIVGNMHIPLGLARILQVLNRNVVEIAAQHPRFFQRINPISFVYTWSLFDEENSDCHCNDGLCLARNGR